MTGRIATLFLSLALAACASGPQTVDFNRDSGAQIKTVAIVLPPEPKKYAVVNMGHPGLVFGLFGGIVVAAEQDRKEMKFYQAMQFQKFSMKVMLAAVLKDKLAAAGYQARVVDAPWQEKDGRFTLQADKIGTEADAILVVVPTSAGFVALGPTADYVPAVTVSVRLLAKDGKTELYRAYHAAGWQPRAEGWRFTPAVRSFSDFDALMARPAESASALGQSIEAVSGTIVQDLRHSAGTK